MIYLDSNATTQIHPDVVEEMLPFFTEYFHNPSSGYKAGKFVKSAITSAREKVANLISAEAEEIIFTGGGTESNNMAIRSLVSLTKSKTIITGEIEHSAVLRVFEDLEKDYGYTVIKIGVNTEGVYDLGQLEEALVNNEVGFISLMFTNNETGVVQPIEKAVALAHKHGVPFHTDAIQAIGKTPLDVTALGVDFLSISGHKFHAPKGVGALYIKKNTRFKPLLLGGGQEKGLRSGTENVASIIGLGKAAELMSEYLVSQTYLSKTGELRDLLYELLQDDLEGVRLNGHPELRTSNTLHVSFDNCDAAGLLVLLNQYGVACSAGSACMTGKQQPSHVQMAMGFSRARANSSLRLSLSLFTLEAEVREAAQLIIKAIKKLRSVQGDGGVGPVVVFSN